MSEPERASIEFVSESDSIDFGIMMKKGVKALTDILANHLQHDPEWKNERSMKFVFKNQNGELQPVLNRTARLEDEGVGPSPDDGQVVDGEETASEQDKLAEANCSDGSSTGDLQLDDPESEVLFDYSLDHLPNISYTPDPTIGKHVMEMIESLLPKGAPYREKVLNTMKNNVQGAGMSTAGTAAVETIQHTAGSTISEPAMSYECDRDLGIAESDDWEHQQFAQPHHGTLEADTVAEGHHRCQSRSSESQHAGHQRAGQEYLYECKPKARPDFHALTMFDPLEQPLCMFCEYYLVFGEPPRQMIKWYNKYGSSSGGPSAGSQQGNKGWNGNKKKKKKKGKKGKR
ncbi:AFR030Cp [Eremothecium gossypii ATCC 10895]|uniref:Protein IBD2 n=1 Tax=Eremothecium gossypii (strain ATCC 10895 / CBS 109.51 / FGSC 9923 / NRRL Y-1056) TaxID=284811 RepID=IBD2_EREGS|nr:AFR030Cp [Eremothecium gossypii ATCC 10895]Q754P2.1 RecName: Full=Protein IBD2 [Eremothecium gossypii ATCC 10895]AAS53401.1 AFR030Cp [Eremothecium gossypii ATCC 10895]AEY97712.1 FAFR030Cp [Eremothecium gossypii FDAG1]